MASSAAARRIPQYVVIGGGLGGLSTAFFLSRLLPKIAANSRITLLESSNSFGGWLHSKSRSLTKTGSIHELGPHSGRAYSPSTELLLRLTASLDLSKDFIWLRSDEPGARQFLYANGKLNPSSNAMSLTAQPPFTRSPTGLITRRLFSKRPLDWRQDCTVDEFFRTRLDDQFADFMASALVRGIFAGDSRQLSMQACLPRLFSFESLGPNFVLGAVRTATFGSSQPALKIPQNAVDSLSAPSDLPKKALAWSLRNGMQQLSDALVNDLSQSPALHLERNASVSNVSKNSQGSYTVQWTSASAPGGQIENVDGVFLTCPAYHTADMLGNLLSPSVVETIRPPSLPWCQVASAVMEVEIDQDTSVPQGFGHLVPMKEDSIVHGVIYDSGAFPQLDCTDSPRLKRFTVMMRPDPMWVSSDNKSVDEQAVLDRAKLVLRDQVGLGTGFKLVDQSVCLLSNAIPQYPVGHLDKIDHLRKSVQDSCHEGLHFVGMSYDGVGLNDVVASGFRAVCRELKIDMV